MITYVIDGNNLFCSLYKISNAGESQKQSVREKLAFTLQRYFKNKKVKVSLHFDGHPNLAINAGKIKIIYSYNAPADENIKKEIENSNNPKNLFVVSSDLAIIKFAKKCSCNVFTSEEFIELLKKSDNRADEETKRIEQLNSEMSIEEFKKLFERKK